MPPAVLELPTEILCAIFEISTSLLSLPTSPISPASTTGTRALRLPSNPTRSDFAALPSLRELTIQCLALSHVCLRWRHVAVGLKSLWSPLHLGSNAFNNHIKRTTAELLARSDPLGLSLDIVVHEGPNVDVHRDAIRDTLHEHVHRCHALRIVSRDLIITDIFDAFIDHTLSHVPSPEHRSLLARIHVIQTSTSLSKYTYPSDLNLVAPNLVSLRVQCASISTYPRWYLQDVFLEEIRLSYHNLFYLFMKSSTKRVVLHRIIVPGGPPYIRRLIDPKESSILSLVLSEPRCIYPEEERQDIYCVFFTQSLFPNLQELELAGLDGHALAGLIEFLQPPPPFVFTELRKLTLRRINMTSQAAVLTMAASFPALREMVLENTHSTTDILVVYDAWMLHGVWPQLHEIVLNGKIVRKK